MLHSVALELTFLGWRPWRSRKPKTRCATRGVFEFPVSRQDPVQGAAVPADPSLRRCCACCHHPPFAASACLTNNTAARSTAMMQHWRRSFRTDVLSTGRSPQRSSATQEAFVAVAHEYKLCVLTYARVMRSAPVSTRPSVCAFKHGQYRVHQCAR